MRKLTLLIVVSLFAGTACWPFDGESPLAEMTLRNVDGLVQILRGDEVIKVGDSDVAVEPGDIIETKRFGLANLRLEGDREAWISGATLERAEAMVVSPTELEGRTGTVVAHAEDAMTVRFGAVTATAEGATFRVDQRAGGARAASFEGQLRLRAPGEPTMNVDRLFEVGAAAGDLRDERPYQLNVDDPFDKRELARVVDLETELQQITFGFASQLTRQRPNLAYFRALGEGINVAPIKKYLRRPTVDLLTAFTIATNTNEYRFRKAINRAFNLHDAGGSWSVVAEILGSKPALLLADLNDIFVATGAVAGGGADDPEFTVAAAQEAADDTTPIEPPPDDDPSGNDDDDGGNGGGGEEPRECTSGPECDVNEIRERIFPSPSPSDLLDGVLQD